MVNGQISIKLPPEKKQRLKEMGEKRGLNITNFVRTLIYAELEKDNQAA